MSNYISLGFWLPIGKSNFYNRTDEASVSDDSSKQKSVFFTVNAKLKQSNFKIEKKILPNYRQKDYADISYPEKIIFKNDEFNYKKLNGVLYIVITNNGFYSIIYKSTNNDSEKNEKYNDLRAYVINQLIGDLKEVDETKTYLKNTNGILNFFQINLIKEGIFNYNFEIENYLNNHNNGIVEKYNIKNFFFNDGVFKNEGIITHTNKLDVKLKNSTNIVSIIQNDNFINLIKEDLLRKFIITSNEHIIRIKWNLELCRRELLNENMTTLHRRQKIKQIENPLNAKENKIVQNANEEQIKGYILFITAKYSLFNNINEFLIFANGRVKNDENVNNWSILLNGIKSNLDSLERTLEQTRMEKMLFEIEELRAEQETVTELARAKDTLKIDLTTNSIESFEISANGLLLSFVAIALTVIIYINEIVAFFFSKQDKDTFKYNLLTDYSLCTRLCILIILVSIPFLYNEILKNIKKTKNIKKANLYQFEIDCRLDETLNSNFFKNETLFLELNKFNTKYYKFGEFIQSSYRIESVNDDYSLHKSHFNSFSKNMNSTIIYEIISHNKSSNHQPIFRTFKFISFSKNKMTTSKLEDLKVYIFKELIEKYISKNDKNNLNETENKDSIFTFSYKLV